MLRDVRKLVTGPVLCSEPRSNSRSLHWKAKEIYFIAVFEIDPKTGEIELDPALWQNYSEKTFLPAEMRLELTGPNHPFTDKIARNDRATDLIEGSVLGTTEYCNRVRAANDKVMTNLNKESELTEAVHTAYRDATWLQDPDLDLPSTFSTLTLKETDHDSHSRG